MISVTVWLGRETWSLGGWIESREQATLILGWRWLWLPPALGLTALAAALPWAAFHGVRSIVGLLRWIRLGFTET